MSSYFVDLSVGKHDRFIQIKKELKKCILDGNNKAFLILFKNIYNELNDNNLNVDDLFRAIGSLIRGMNVEEDEKKNINSFIINNKENFNIIIQNGIINGYFTSSIIEKMPGGFYQNNDGILSIFKSVIDNYHHNNVDFSIDRSFDGLIEFLFTNTGNNYYKELFDFIKENKNEPFIYDYMSFLSLEQFMSIDYIRSNWENIKSDGFHKIINEVKDVDVLKNVLCLEIYHVRYEEMMDMYYQYFISNKNEEISNQLSIFEEIIISKSREDLLSVLNGYNKEEKSFNNVYNETFDFLQNEMRKSYEDSKIKLDSLKIEDYKGIRVCDISNSNFNLIIHNISASIHHKIDFSDTSFWEKDDNKGSITISCSNISEKYLGHLTRSNNEVYFGFDISDGNNVFYSVGYDSGVSTSVEEYDELNSSDGKNKVFSFLELANNSFYEYNEVVINRYLDRTKKKKVLPNYIVVFDDENDDKNFDSINEDSIRFAKHFNIPVLYINTRKIIDKNVREILLSIHSTCNEMELLKNINSVFSFIGGIKFSNKIQDVDKIDWYDEILQSVDSVLSNKDKSSRESIPLLMILGRLPLYKRGMASTFNGGMVPETLLSKFDDFSNSIKNKINNHSAIVQDYNYR